ncbi:MAG: V-type ATP synthase subunit I [Termitinemataceae bacterium]|nr:MAG: V-type ATP synthase subunit I [Termitinemataceae bacterium]
MILPMKKVTLLVMDKNKEVSLKAIRDLGLIHLQRKDVASDNLSQLLEQKTAAERAKGILLSVAPKHSEELGVLEMPKTESSVSFILSLADKIKQKQDKFAVNAKEISRIEKWRGLDLAKFNYLVEHGVILVPYELPRRSYDALGDRKVIVLSKNKTTVRCLSVGLLDKSLMFFELPQIPIEQLELEQKEITAEIAELERRLKSCYGLLDDVNKEIEIGNYQIEFETAKIGMDKMGDVSPELTVSWITGYVPSEDLGLLKRAAAENNWALLAEDPKPEDETVPTKLKNNKFSSLIYPLTNFLETVPGYRETDISGVFLLFFCIFFGMLFGDAAYGIVLGLIGLIGIAKTAKTGIPAGFKFLMLLAISNTAWGVITCTWFGIAAEKLPQFLKDISLYQISNVTASLSTVQVQIIGSNQFLTMKGAAYVSQNLQVFCFILALIQLTFAHLNGIVRTIREKSLRCLAEVGSIAMLWGVFALVLYLVVNPVRFPFLGPQFLNTVLMLIGSGFIVNFIFAGYEGSIIKSILNSLKNIITVILGLTNVFSDIMSYIRLWAVGLAGASISATVNAMAGPALGDFLIFLGIIVLIFGHGLNMVLNTLSVLVHGVRLNTLEFSGHIGLTWAGVAYKPFAKR